MGPRSPPATGILAGVVVPWGPYHVLRGLGGQSGCLLEAQPCGGSERLWRHSSPSQHLRGTGGGEHAGKWQLVQKDPSVLEQIGSDRHR